MSGAGAASMTNLSEALTTAVTPSALYEALGAIIPFVGTMIVFAFSYMVLRKVVRGSKNGKPKI